MSSEKPRNRTIKMTDSEYNRLRSLAIERNLTNGKLIGLLCEEYKSNELSPEIICKLQTVRNLLEVPQKDWNKEMKVLFNDTVEELCAML